MATRFQVAISLSKKDRVYHVFRENILKLVFQYGTAQYFLLASILSRFEISKLHLSKKLL